MNIHSTLSLFLTFLLCCSVSAQNGWNWPDDKAAAQEKNALYTDALKNDNFVAALDYLMWLHEHAPDLNPSIYINGQKIYEGLADKETDPVKKLEFQAKALQMYDLRIKYFNEEANVLNRKASTAYKFYRGIPEKYPELLAVFEKALELNGNELFDGNTIAYMDIIRRYQRDSGNLTDEDILDRHDRISEVLASKEGDNIQTMQDKIDEMLLEVVTVDCDYIDQNLGAKLQEEPDNIKVAKKIIQLSLGQCTDSEIFMVAAKTVFEAEPDYRLAKVIALKCKGNGDNTCTVDYLTKALALTNDNAEKGEIYLILGAMQSNSGAKSMARNYYRQAVSADPNLAEKAYTSIGNLYYGGFQDCKEGKSKVEDRGCYLAAYEMYRRAGNTEGMERAQQQFPTKEEVFLEGKSMGSRITVGCWIDETVEIKTRD